jgi:hypothetical protein
MPLSFITTGRITTTTRSNFSLSPCSTRLEEDPAACAGSFLRLRAKMRGKLAARCEQPLRMLIESIESTPNGIPQE